MAAGELLARVLASDRVAYQGYAEARAGLGLPDVPRAGRVVALLGETTRMRPLVAGPEVWRVDELTPVGDAASTTTGGGPGCGTRGSDGRWPPGARRRFGSPGRPTCSRPSWAGGWRPPPGPAR